MQIETVKIKPSSEEQGEFVIINKEDFDENAHELFEEQGESAEPKKRGRPAKD